MERLKSNLTTSHLHVFELITQVVCLRNYTPTFNIMGSGIVLPPPTSNATMPKVVFLSPFETLLSLVCLQLSILFAPFFPFFLSSSCLCAMPLSSGEGGREHFATSKTNSAASQLPMQFPISVSFVWAPTLSLGVNTLGCFSCFFIILTRFNDHIFCPPPPPECTFVPDRYIIEHIVFSQ